MTVTRKGPETGPKSWMLAIGVGRITVPENVVWLVATAALIPALAGCGDGGEGGRKEEPVDR